MEDSKNYIELIDKNTQHFLKNKYNVTFFDTLPDQKTEKFNDNPIIKRIDSMFQGKLLNNKKIIDYAPFDKYKNISDAEINNKHATFNTINMGNINKDNNHNIVYSIKKNEHLYKGTHSFITPEKEKKFLEKSDSLQPYWFGANLVGYLYSQRYNGGLNSYKLKNDTNLFIINDTRNEKTIINFVNNLNEKDLKIIGFSKYEIIESVRVSYGYDCNIGYQINFIKKYNKYPDFWMSRYVDKKLVHPEIMKYRNKRIYSAGKLDRTFGRFMCYFCSKNNYNGYCTLFNYTIFFTYGVLHDEIVICDQDENVERDINDPLDWYQWKHLIPINFDSEIFKNFIYNKNFYSYGFVNIFKNYYDNQLDNKRNSHILDIIRDTKPKFKFITLNVNSFMSPNNNDTFEIIINKIKNLLDIFNIDFCFLQEYCSNVSDEYIESIFTNYNILKSQKLDLKNSKYFGNILLTKDKLNKYQFNVLSEYKNVKRISLNFEINNKNAKDLIFCSTQLEIGDSYKERNQSFKSHENIIDTYNKNVNERILEINKIIDIKPDVILGNFNFTKDDPEYEHISNSYKDSIKEEYHTLPNNERVDYIFTNKSKNINCNSYVVSYPYSKNLPVIGLIY